MSTSTPPAPGAAPVFTSYQKFVVAVLTFLQFTVVLDFMIMAPLGARLMDALKLPASTFGVVMASYAISACVSGFLTAGFADRFDRKRLLLFFYAGFVVGTLLCGLAPDYHFLLMARIVTGLFGGVIASISMAIITDLFVPQVRGRVMGFVQMGFSLSQVAGIPLGLVLSDHWGWHAPFLMIVAVASVVGLIIAWRLRPIDAHLGLPREGNPLRHLVRTVARADYLQAFACTTVLVTGGFLIMPFSSAFTVHNLGIPLDRLKVIYLVTGLFTAVSGPLLGRLSDRIGKYILFCAGSVLTMVMVVIYTHLGVTPMLGVIAVNVLVFIGVTSRIISAMALISAVPDAPDRGSFMSVNSSVQQLSGGVASGLGSLVIAQDVQGRLLHFDILGYVVVVSMMAAMLILRGINRRVSAKTGRPAMAATRA